MAKGSAGKKEVEPVKHVCMYRRNAKQRFPRCNIGFRETL